MQFQDKDSLCFVMNLASLTKNPTEKTPDRGYKQDNMLKIK